LSISPKKVVREEIQKRLDTSGFSPLFDPDYFDGHNHKLGILIDLELVRVVKSRYHTLEASQFWALSGLISGGRGA
jgi:hypothetical protein